jgi:tetratricopeptide (TPR) repeat protein
LLAIFVLNCPVLGFAQSPEPANSAVLRGFVRDSLGHPVAGVKVCAQSGSRTQTASTDAAGAYHLAPLSEGTYTLRAEMDGYSEATFGPVVLGLGDSKSVDLRLEPTKPSQSANTATEKLPEFYDEPQFTVAGVTESMNPGGHGSDRILRTAETLARDTALLNRKASDQPRPAGFPEETLQAAVRREPRSFDANYRLGKALTEDGRADEAIEYLEHASQLKPGDYQNSYELARAYATVGRYEPARTKVATLLAEQDRAELHHLLGDIDEKQGKALEAVHEYERAAELTPSEANLFDWGSELLVHRAAEPAIEVFAKGNRLFPRSIRMLVGLGSAWYARGSYDRAAKYLCEASDLDPNDWTPYLFLGKMQGVETTQSEQLAEKLTRFARLQPENALANYYYALSVWKRRQSQSGTEAASQVESLLQKAIRIDPKLGPAYLQLGIIYADRQEFQKAITAYQKAIEVAPQLEEAYYRLSQAYARTGDKLQAQKQLQLYDEVSKKTAEQVERERRETQQFVYTLRSGQGLPQ